MRVSFAIAQSERQVKEKGFQRVSTWINDKGCLAVVPIKKKSGRYYQPFDIDDGEIVDVNRNSYGNGMR